MKQVEWTEPALEDLGALDKGIARRVKQAVERFAATGTGNVKKLQDIEPPEYRLRVGDYRVRFHLGMARPFVFCAYGIGARRIDNLQGSRT